MTRLRGEFRTDVPVREAVVACARAADSLGWRVEEMEAERIVSRAGAGTPDSPQIEIALSESGQGTAIRITGGDTEAAPLSQDALIAELDRTRDAIQASLGGALRQPTAAPPAKRPKRARGPRRIRRRIAPLAIAAGLAAVAGGGLAIVLSGGGSGSGQTSQVAVEGISASGGSSAGASAQPPLPAPLGLDHTKVIRDGGRRFTLTPTAIGRSGDYITVEVEVTGLGAPGTGAGGQAISATLVGSDGSSYTVQEGPGPSGCQPPVLAPAKGSTVEGCLRFKLPPQVQAATFRYQPLSAGGTEADWLLGG